ETPTSCTVDPTGKDAVELPVILTLDTEGLTVGLDTNGNVAGFVKSPIFGLGPQVVDCGHDDTICTTAQNFGTVFELQAAANAGFRFVNWTSGTGGPCNGLTTAICDVTLSGNFTITPHYAAIPTGTLNVVTSSLGHVTLSGPHFPVPQSCFSPGCQ